MENIDKMISITTQSMVYQLDKSNEPNYKWDKISDSQTEEADHSQPFSTYLKIFIGLILVLIILVSILGNIMVCLAISSDRRLRRLGNLFLASLGLRNIIYFKV
jgi:hypothetical protein